MSDKKKKQLGMNPSTARSRLIQDVMWMLIVKCGNNSCHHCNEPMSRETFSVEHMEPWLDSEDPVGLYFDLENISFSHQSCNSGAARRPHAYKDVLDKEQRQKKSRKRNYENNFNYNSKTRREQYLRTGT